MLLTPGRTGQSPPTRFITPKCLPRAASPGCPFLHTLRCSHVQWRLRPVAWNDPRAPRTLKFSIPHLRSHGPACPRDLSSSCLAPAPRRPFQPHSRLLAAHQLTKLGPVSGPLHLLLPLPGTLFPAFELASVWALREAVSRLKPLCGPSPLQLSPPHLPHVHTLVSVSCVGTGALCRWLPCPLGPAQCSALSRWSVTAKRTAQGRGSGLGLTPGEGSPCCVSGSVLGGAGVGRGDRNACLLAVALLDSEVRGPPRSPGAGSPSPFHRCKH